MAMVAFPAPQCLMPEDTDFLVTFTVPQLNFHSMEQRFGLIVIAQCLMPQDTDFLVTFPAPQSLMPVVTLDQVPFEARVCGENEEGALAGISHQSMERPIG